MPLRLRDKYSPVSYSGCFRLERSPGATCIHWKAPPLHGVHVEWSLLIIGIDVVLGGIRGVRKSLATRSRCARPTAFQCESTRQDACDKAPTKMSVMAQVASRLDRLKPTGRDRRAGMEGGDERGHAEARADKRVGSGAASVEPVGYVEPIDRNLIATYGRDMFRSCSRSGRAWSCHRCCCESLAHTIAAAAGTRRPTGSAASTARCSCRASRICCNSRPRVWYADSGFPG
jgi:hypothetical protein